LSLIYSNVTAMISKYIECGVTDDLRHLVLVTGLLKLEVFAQERLESEQFLEIIIALKFFAGIGSLTNCYFELTIDK
jgi:hypothetical protein